jgi:hypothetical protein
MVSDDCVAEILWKWTRIVDTLDERGRRIWAATEACACGYGGIMAVHRATGMARRTIGEGIRELGLRGSPAETVDPGRTRRPGAGRKKLTETDTTLQRDLEVLVAPATRGDPMSPLLWTSKSAQNLATELNKDGHRVGPNTVTKLLKEPESARRCIPP